MAISYRAIFRVDGAQVAQWSPEVRKLLKMNGKCGILDV